MPDPAADRIRDLNQRRSRLLGHVRRLQDAYDRERVDEQLRLEPLIEQRNRALAEVESEILRLERERGTSHRKPLQLFYSYSRQDAELRKRLAVFLKPLERDGLLSTWYDGAMEPGVEWNAEILGRLREADIVLLLVSADFMASDYIWSKEIGIALERHRQEKASVIPVLLRPCDWEDAPFSHIAGLPSNMEPITSWPNLDDAFTDVAIGLRRMLQAQIAKE